MARDHFLFIDKPAGIMVHPDERNDEKTISDILKENYDVDGVGDIGREGVVHRLDRNTTGVLLLAKDKIAFTTFKKQFKKEWQLYKERTKCNFFKNYIYKCRLTY